VEANPQIPWNWATLSKNPNITIEIIKKYPNKRWDWFNISMNPAITFDMILEDIYMPWNWYGVSQNPNITWSIINSTLADNGEFLISWKWYDLSINQFCHHPYFRSEVHKKKLVKQFLDKCWKELIQEACHPSRILNWNDDYLEDCKNGSDEEREIYLAECVKHEMLEIVLRKDLL
jgi:hypothetical protein